jgi:3-deoxy-D-manno-octulosonic-acid transferase
VIWLYRILARFVYLLLYPYGRRRAASGDELWRGRLALERDLEPVDIWMHAASVGEVKVLANLVNYLNDIQPELKLHVSAMTRTGLATAHAAVGDKATVSAFPVDATPAVVRKLDSLQPRMIVVAETEIWPNLICLATARNIPLVLVNGRMTERSLKKYLRFKASLGRLLAGYDRFFFKSEADRGRFSQLGLDPNRVEVVGDMKFDAPLIEKSVDKFDETRRQFGVGRDDFLFVAGSTRPGEEALLLDICEQMKPHYPGLRLVLAPRHLERLNEVKKVLAQCTLRSATLGEVASDADVILVDRMGLLNSLYEIADLAFVGGTLVDVGGHNLLEPVWVQTPVVYGPSLDNVAEAAEYIERCNYGARVNSAAELGTLVEDVIAGRRTFDVRDRDDLKQSAVATIGSYLLERIAHA